MPGYTLLKFKSKIGFFTLCIFIEPLHAEQGWQKFPPEFKQIFKGRNFELRKIAPHEAEFREKIAVWDSLAKPPRMTSKWSLIDPRKSIPTGMNEMLRECWFALATGAESCSKEKFKQIEDQIIRTQNFAKKTDLLLESRRWVKEVGLRRTRDLMKIALARYDSDNGAFEKRALKAGKDAKVTYPDSLMAIPKEKRQRIGIFVALGYAHAKGLPSKIMRQLVRRVSEQGFQSMAFNTESVGPTPKNSETINRELRAQIEQVDYFYLIGASKGSHEITHFILNHFPKWSDSERQKLRGIVSMSGVLRSAYIGDWVSQAEGFRMDLLRSVSRKFTHENETNDGLTSTRVDFWESMNVKNIQQLLPENFVWICFSMLPSGEDGHIPDEAILSKYSRHAMRFLNDRGPTDGLVETAATILPPGLGLRQWIVRGLGSHVPSLGTFLDGTPISRIGHKTEPEVIASGASTMDSLLKILPASPNDFQGY